MLPKYQSKCLFSRNPKEQSNNLRSTINKLNSVFLKPNFCCNLKSFHSFKHLHKYLVCKLENAKPIQIPNTTSDISLLRNRLKFGKKKNKEKTEEIFWTNHNMHKTNQTISNEASTSKHNISKNTNIEHTHTHRHHNINRAEASPESLFIPKISPKDKQKIWKKKK